MALGQGAWQGAWQREQPVKVWAAEEAGQLEEQREGGRDGLSVEDGQDGERGGWRVGGKPCRASNAYYRAVGAAAGSTWGVATQLAFLKAHAGC